MPYDPVQKARVQKRREAVWKRHQQGVAVSELARFYGVSSRVIHRDIALMREQKSTSAEARSG